MDEVTGEGGFNTIILFRFAFKWVGMIQQGPWLGKIWQTGFFLLPKLGFEPVPHPGV